MLMRPWNRRSSEAMPGCLTHGNCEITKLCCFIFFCKMLLQLQTLSCNDATVTQEAASALLGEKSEGLKKDDKRKKKDHSRTTLMFPKGFSLLEALLAECCLRDEHDRQKVRILSYDAAQCLQSMWTRPG
ncbi:uncharacterized protein LOC143663472 [Tamandua tetradactyla]|uniref:uncharacterized protein LOC143663472 n=1 Tax=Tamandua tetradactyla TaxID=48850 RepID=UPI0040541EFD